MHRPKKTKVLNPTLPKDQQVDERHLIDAEDSADISIEDRIHLYWMENRSFIAGCILLLALVIIGFNGYRIYDGYAASKIQAAFSEAKAAGELESFAQAYSNQPLGGVAAVSVADNAYETGDFAAAAEFYAIAVNALNNDLLAGRARIGLAFATFQSGDELKGLSLLEAIAADATLPQPIWKEAAYHLAIEADMKRDEDGFQKYASQITDSGVAGPWSQRIRLYQPQR